MQDDLDRNTLLILLVLFILSADPFFSDTVRLSGLVLIVIRRILTTDFRFHHCWPDLIGAKRGWGTLASDRMKKTHKLLLLISSGITITVPDSI